MTSDEEQSLNAFVAHIVGSCNPSNVTVWRFEQFANERYEFIGKVKEKLSAKASAKAEKTSAENKKPAKADDDDDFDDLLGMFNKKK